MKKIIFTTTILVLFVSCAVTKKGKSDYSSYQPAIENSTQSVGQKSVQAGKGIESVTEKNTVSSTNSVSLVQKQELKITPEIEEMVFSAFRRFINFEAAKLIKDKSQLTSLQLERPIPVYYLNIYDTLQFIGRWRMILMSDSDPLVLADVRLKDDGQYSCSRIGADEWAERLYNYEDKDLVIGYIIARGSTPATGIDYLYIQKENKDIFVELYDYATREWFKNEYSLNDIINLRKK